MEIGERYFYLIESAKEMNTEATEEPGGVLVLIDC